MLHEDIDVDENPVAVKILGDIFVAFGDIVLLASSASGSSFRMTEVPTESDFNSRVE